MSFLAPAAFGLAALIGPLIALYMLRSRRKRVVVPSTMLWEQAGVPVSSAVPWQRLRTTPLLWLQIAVLLLLAVALTRPFASQVSLLGPHTVLVMDTSGSMAMGSRWADARAQALDLAADVSDANLVSVVDAGPTPRVVVAFSRDPELVADAVRGLQPTGGVENLDQALRLARGLETPDRPTSILILSDGGPQGSALTAEPVVGARQLRYDDVVDNVGISAFSTDPSGEGELRLFLELANWSEEERSSRVEIAVNDLPVLITPVSMSRLGRGRATLPIDAGPGDVVTATIVETGDGNPLDDRATLMVPVPRTTEVALVGEGSAFLDALIRSLPNYVPGSLDSADIVIMDGVSDGLFDRPMWLIAPDAPPDGVEIEGTAQNLVVTFQQPGEPLLDELDMADLVVGEAQIVNAIGWLPIVRAGDLPLVLLGQVNGHRAVYFTFDITESNLPVLVSFPILGSRIFEHLAGANAATVLPEPAGMGIPLAPPPGAAVQVVTPAGPVSVPEGATVFAGTGSPGLYLVQYIDESGEVSNGPVALRSFVPTESAGDFRDIAVAESPEVEADRGTLISEWAAWFLASVLVLLLLEWWVGHRRPVRAREIPA